MINQNLKLNPKLFTADIEKEPTRFGYGRGIVVAGKADKNVVALSADLTGSTKTDDFKKEFPDRFIQVGIGEQNMASVAAGLSAAGKVPFFASYAMFSPGRNWEQIRTTICYNNSNCKVAGAHAGVSVGPDGATHQAIEDVALTRVIPRMTVIVPCDSVETEKATIAAAKMYGPVYLRYNREKTPIITTKDTPFEIGKAITLREGKDVSVFACGQLVYRALQAAEELSKEGVDVEVVNVHTIKPLDEKLVIESVKKTNCVVSVEEHQIAGGLGSVIAETLAKNYPAPMEFVGVNDRFGESGDPDELLEKFGLTSEGVKTAIKKVISRRK